MKRLFNESLLRRFNLLAWPLVVAWSLSTLGGTFLASRASERFIPSFDSFFEIFHLGNKFGIAEHFAGAINTKTVTSMMLVPQVHRIKAIYRSADGSFVSISDANKTTIVALQGIYKKTFRLSALSNTTALFRGYGKTYRLRLGFDDNLSRQEIVTRSIPDPTKAQSIENEWRSITYQTIADQLNNLQNLEKTIDVTPSMSAGKITGFRVNTIAPDSVFAQLGIVGGDVIQSVNNKKLESYSDALAVIGQLPHLRSIRIIVLRNNLQKELVYEITR
ncbi:MAG: hypothetical protein ACXWB0_03585 [Sulfuricurvum sp.]